MKIITKCIIRMSDLKTIYEESHDYQGNVALCKGGGGGGSGKVEYPGYMQTVHGEWLDNAGADVPTSSMVDAINAAYGNSPWTGKTAYNPDTYLADSATKVSDFLGILSLLDSKTDWVSYESQAKTTLGTFSDKTIADALVGDRIVIDATAPATVAISDLSGISTIAITDKTLSSLSISDKSVSDLSSVQGITDAEITADVTAFADQLDDEITTKILPRFNRGMQDINAVSASSFVIGQAIIEAFRDRDVAKHSSTLHLAAAEKNADIELGVGQININKDVELAKVNLGKDIEVGRINSSKDLELVKTNLSKDLELDRLNSSNTIEIGRTNLNKDIDVSKINTTTALSIVDMNLKKDISLAESNLSKDTSLAKVNLAKESDLVSVNTQASINYLKLYLESVSQMFNYAMQGVGYYREMTTTAIENNRISIVAKKEESDYNDKIDENDVVWDMSVFQNGANLLAAPGGGVLNPKSDMPSQAQSALGGAMTGAAAGGMIAGASEGAIAGPVGIGVGAVLGLASSFL